MGKLYVVGFGPGNYENMTELCIQKLRASDIIVGYTGYIEMLKPFFTENAFYETGMTREVDRCRKAIELACQGKTVSVVSSGDSGIYGMASLIYELASEMEIARDLEIEIIPGVTAAVSGAALLGAPLSHDFTVISLSDLLTPWETIEKRLQAAAAGDFAICLYNPGSKKRTDYLQKACDILLENLPEDRPCGIAKNIGRQGQAIRLLSLKELRECQADMQDTVFIGNSATKNIGGHLVTPRGYRNG